MIGFLASPVFRLILIPVATVGLGSFTRYFMKKLKREDITSEILIVWPDLLIASLFNLLLAISNLSEQSSPSINRLLGLFASSLGLLLLLWANTAIAAALRTKRARIVIWTYGVPHLLALASLEGCVLLTHFSGGVS